MTFRRNPRFAPALRKQITERLMAGGQVVVRTARDRMERGESSAPGESPVTQSGELADSLQTYGPRDTRDGIEVAAGTDLHRIIWLERGTAYIAPRPLLLPSLLQAAPDIMAAMRGEVRRGA